MKKIFDQLNERGKVFQVLYLSMSTNALKIRKKQICQQNSCEFRKINSSIWNNLGEICKCFNFLPVFGFKSGRYDLNLVKSFLIPYLFRDKEQETSAIKKQMTLYLSSLEMNNFST